MSIPSQPPHIGFDCWNLAEAYNPELLRDQLVWLMNDTARRESAINNMQPILGFNALVVALSRDEDTGRVNESIQLNFYDGSSSGGSDKTPLTEEPHGHSKDAIATWYAPKGTSQIITRHNILPSNELALAGAETEQRLVVANCIEGFGNGRRSQYHLLFLGSTAISTLSRSWVTNGGRTFFTSTEVHSVSTLFKEIDQVAISVHYKSRVESDVYNTLDGLVRYKKLTPEQATDVLNFRKKSTGYLGPVTMMYPPEERFSPDTLHAYPSSTDPAQAKRLLSGGLTTIIQLCS